MKTFRALLIVAWGFLSLWPLAAQTDPVASGTPESIREAIRNGLDVRERRNDGYTWLMDAASTNQNVAVISVLIQAGADVNAKTNNGFTALMIAARYSKNAEIISALVQAGADKEAKLEDGTTAIMPAAHFNPNPQVVLTLSKAGADVNAKVGIGITALMLAANWNPSSEVTAALLEAGADVNAKTVNGDTALQLAAYKNPNPEVVSVLLQAGADANVRSSNGGTALDRARANPAMQNTAAYQQLAAVTRTVDVNQLVRSGSADDVQQAIQNHSIDHKARSSDGSTWLMYASQYNPNADAVSALIQAGADVNAKNQYGATALMLAAYKNSNPAVVSALLQAGADVNEKNTYGDTALLLAAAFNQNPEVVSVLLNAGANVNEKNTYGATPLMLAAFKNQNPEVVSKLLRAGADANAIASNGGRALDSARANPAMQNTVAYQQLAAVTTSNQPIQQSNSNQGSGSDLANLFGGLSSLAQAIGGATGNQGFTEAGQGLSLAQQATNLATGNTSGDSVSTYPQVAVQGGSGSGGYHNDWPHSLAVHTLLRFGNGPNPPEVDGPDTQRNDLIKAAIVAAWGADKEGQKGNIRDAIRLSSMMHDDLKNAFSLLSNGAPITGETAGLIISEQELQRLAGE